MIQYDTITRVVHDTIIEQKTIKVKNEDIDLNFTLKTYQNTPTIDDFSYRILRPTQIIKKSVNGFYLGGFAGVQSGGVQGLYLHKKIAVGLGYDLINKGLMVNLNYKLF